MQPGWIEEKAVNTGFEGSTDGKVLNQRFGWDGTGLIQEFTVEVAGDGDYLLGAWVDGMEGRSFDIHVDGSIPPGTAFSCGKEGWQYIQALNGETPSRLRLKAGRHVVSIRGTRSEASRVEWIRLGRSGENTAGQDESYRHYVEDLVAGSLPATKVGASEGGHG